MTEVQDVQDPINNEGLGEGPNIQDNASTKADESGPAPVPEKPSDGGLSDEEYAKLAIRLGDIVDRALEKLEPILEMITRHIDKANAVPEDELDEEKLVEDVRPLLEQGSGILNNVLGQIKGVDPTGEVQNKAKRNAQDHKATPEEQRLAEGLAKLTEKVMKTIDNARDKIKNMPHAKDKLGPLFALMSDPLFQIISAVGLLLNGVLTLLGNILGGLGLGGLLNNLLDALGLNKLLNALGLSSLSKSLAGDSSGGKASKKK